MRIAEAHRVGDDVIAGFMRTIKPMDFYQKRTRSGWIFILLALLCVSIFAADTLVLSQKLFDYVQWKYGATAKQRVMDWEKTIGEGKKLPEPEKLQLTNDFFNRVPYYTDQEHWGGGNYWATPVETLATNGGDCEDYAIGKYFTLLAMGMPMDKLKITYAKALKTNQPHMILAYYDTPNADPLILDNLDKVIRHGAERDDLMPVYSFNADGLWLAKERGNGRRISGSDRFSIWNDLIARMSAEAK